jgi:serine phosphatase RsbU (regulator of sigma subunit)/anti-sigma regulatory factor (Ser/Thr protein kinase)
METTSERFESERQQFLVESTALLDASLDPNETMQNVVSRAVPTLGELSVVDMLNDDGTITKIAVAGEDPAAARELGSMRQRFPVDPDGVHPVAKVIRTGQPALLAELTDEIMREIAESDEHLELMRRLRYSSALVVPLSARGRILGALSVLRLGDGGSNYVEEDLDMLAELGRRAAVALDNARLHTEARRAEQRQRLLARSSEILNASLDYEETLGDIARITVPEMADWCAIDIVDDAGRVERLAVAHVDAEKERLGWELAEAYPVERGQTEGVMRAIGSGEPVLYPEVSDQLREAVAADDRHLDGLRRMGFDSAIVVPIAIRDRIAGALSFAAGDSGPTYDDEDVELALELARRAASAIENSRLYKERTYIARTLQEGLLPPTLPELPGVELATRFRAAGELNEVGGDFYDVFQVSDGAWALVMGDVCGKGPEAAAVTALARYSLRAFAIQPRPEEIEISGGVDPTGPVRRLRQLNEALLRQRTDARFCTVTYGRLELGETTPTLTITCAGHPPALLLHAYGDVEALDSAGAALGLFPRLELASRTVELAPNDAVIFYTDGVTDAGAPQRVLSQDDLARVLRDCAGQSAEQIAQRVEDEALSLEGARQRDDVAILVMRMTGTGGAPGDGKTAERANGPASRDEALRISVGRDPAIRLRVPPEPESVSRARGVLAGLRPDVDERMFADLLLLVSELVTNSIRYARPVDSGGPMWLQIFAHEDRVRVEMTDGGPGFAPRVHPAPDGSGGWGLYFVDQLSDRWGVLEDGGLTCVWLEMDRERETS